jgi:N-acyl-D-amino-acid deacylase
MRKRSRLLSGAVALVFSLVLAAARGEDAPAADHRARVTAAVERGLPLVVEAAGRYPTHRQCFSCHHQTLPMLAMVAARSAGLKIDEQALQAQADFTHTSFKNELEDLRAGKGIGGKALTVSYGLWTLSLAGRKGDEVSEAMVTYLLKTQEADGHWSLHANRPPLEESSETTAVLSLIGLRMYVGDEQKSAVEAAEAKAAGWFDAQSSDDADEPPSQEDRVSRLWSLQLLGRPAEAVEAARMQVLSSQNDDGGFGQLDSMPSDAYATGQTLCVLFMTGSKPADDACRRGTEYLLSTQSADGSWFVKSRSKPVQVYFDNGDPHGKDQFISTPASCWALVALAMSLRGGE